MENEITNLQTQITQLKAEIANFNNLFYTGNFSNRDARIRTLEVSPRDNIELNSNETVSSKIIFNYDYMGTPAKRGPLYTFGAEENGGTMHLKDNAGNSLMDIGDATIVLGTALDEFDVYADNSYFEGDINAMDLVATPAGGKKAFTMGSSNTAICWGSGAPSLSAAKGSLYLRTDGTTTNDRAYINTNGSTTWTALTTAA